MDEAKAAFSAFQAAHSEIQARFQTRLMRTYEMLQEIDPLIANQVFGRKSEPVRVVMSARDRAAVKIQKVYKGWKARKQYLDLLYAQYEEEEERTRETELRRMEEGMLLLDTIQLQQTLKDRQFLQRQHTLERTHAATLIQRAYRRHRGLSLSCTALTVIPAPPSHAPVTLDISAVIENEEEEENEVFTKMHNISRDSDYEPDHRTYLKISSTYPHDMDRTSCSVALDLVRFDAEDMALSQALPEHPIRPSHIPRPDSGLLSVPYLARLRAECRVDSYAHLTHVLQDLRAKANSLSETLVQVLEEREKLHEHLEFSRRLIKYLSSK